MSNTEKHEQAEKAAGLIYTLLTGWGLPGGIARIAAGAIIGALAVAYTLLGSSCTASFSQAADGSIQYNHELKLPLPEMSPPAEAQAGKVEPSTK